MLRSFQFCSDEEFLRGCVVFNTQDVRFTADLAILDIALAASGGLVDRRRVPLSAGSALETRFHEGSLPNAKPQGHEEIVIVSPIARLRALFADQKVLRRSTAFECANGL